MSKIKISVYAFLVSSLFIFACATDAARGASGASQSNEESSDSLAEPKTYAAAVIKFKGSIGAAEFEMTLRRTGDGDLSGSYFYAKSRKANALALRGKIDANGKFTLRETDASGRETGEFKGVWHDEADESSVSIEGEWRAPGDEKGVNFLAAEVVISFTGNTRIIDRKFSSPLKAIRLDVAAD